MKTLRRCGLVSLGLAPIAIVAWFWLFWLSPWTYERPASLPDVESGKYQLFVYGTLRYAPLRWVVYGRTGDPKEVELTGYRREGLDLHSDDDASVQGLLLTIDAEELQRLDRYERLGIRYSRQRVKLDTGRQAWVYQRLQD